MKTIFCPLCKSIMKNGICTNRNCGNSKLEIDFNNFVKDFVKVNDVKLKQINNSYLCGKDLFSESLTHERVLKCNSLGALKVLIEAGIDVNVKITNFLVDEKTGVNLDNYCVSKLIYYPIQKAKPIPKKIFKHYIEYGICVSKAIGGNSSNFNGQLVFGSNDLKEWKPAGFNSICNAKFDEEMYSKLLILASFSLTKSVLWTVSITDNKTGISIKTFFEKEMAYQLFKDREIKQGKKRRTALKHIVNKYEREKPNKKLVDEHFRGSMTFEWRGLNFRLSPPQIDEERILNQTTAMELSEFKDKCISAYAKEEEI